MRNNNSNECATCFEDTYGTSSSLPSRGALPALPSALRSPAAWLMAGRRHRSRRDEPRAAISQQPGRPSAAARRRVAGRGPTSFMCAVGTLYCTYKVLIRVLVL